MADVSGNVSNSLLTLESLTHIANLFLIFVVGSAVPLIRWIWKTQETKRQANRKAEDDRIAKICQEQIRPLDEKLTKLLDNQTDMISKVNYIDRVFQDNVSFGGRNPRKNYRSSSKGPLGRSGSPSFNDEDNRDQDHTRDGY